MNRTLALAAEPLEIQAAEADKPATFSGVAYTGGVMSVTGWGPIVANLGGIDIPDRVPILADHENTLQGVVGSGRAYVENGKLLVAGTIARGTPAGDMVIALAKSGVPLQMSIGTRPTEVVSIRTGKKVQANGREHVAPDKGLKHITKSQLGEITITPLGADAETYVDIAATQGGVMSEGTETITIDELKKLDNVCDFMRGHVAANELSAWRAEVLEGSLSVDELYKRGFESLKAKSELESIRASRPRSVGHRSGRDEPAGPEILQCAFASRISPDLAAKVWGEQTVEASRRFSNMTMLDFIRAAGEMQGLDMPSTPDGLLKAAASNLTLAEILTTAPQRVLESQLQNSPATWGSIARRREAKDFRTHKSIRLLSNRGLQKIGADGTVQHDNLSEESFSWSIDTYAKQIQLTRRDVINDDLGAFQDLPQIFANDAIQSIGDVFYTVLNAGQTAGFFASGNGNLMEAGSALSEASLATAIRKLREMTDVKAKQLNLVPKVLVVTPKLEFTARKLLNSAEVAAAAGNPTGNALQGVAQLEVEARINTAGGGNDDNWYLFAEPGAMQVAFLNSTTPQPVIDFFNFSDQIDHLSLGWRIVLDHGSARGDHRMAIKATGAA